MLLGELGNLALEFVPAFGRVIGSSVHTGHLLRIGAVAPEHLFERIGHLAHGGAQADGPNRQIQQVALSALGSGGQRLEGCLHGRVVALGFDGFQASDLAIAHLDVVDLEDIHWVFLGQLVFVDADNHILARVDAGLLLRRGRFNLEFGPTTVHRLGHAAHGIDFLDDGPGFVHHLLRQALHHVGTGPGIDHIRDVGFFLDDQLRVACDARTELGGQGNGLIE